MHAARLLALALAAGVLAVSGAGASASPTAARSCRLIVVATPPSYGVAFERVRRVHVSCALARRVLTRWARGQPLGTWRCHEPDATFRAPGSCARGTRRIIFSSMESTS